MDERRVGVRVRSCCLLGLLLFLPQCNLPVHAVQQSSSVQSEIASLLTSLEQSGCQFNRNGSWYKGADAKNHLTEKLQYLEDNVTLQSTEQFIEMAASSSSVSGKPYMVKCGNAPPVQSRVWLLEELKKMRMDAGSRRPTPK
jgi:hypothetical protein